MGVIYRESAPVGACERLKAGLPYLGSLYAVMHLLCTFSRLIGNLYVLRSSGIDGRGSCGWYGTHILSPFSLRESWKA